MIADEVMRTGAANLIKVYGCALLVLLVLRVGCLLLRVGVGGTQQQVVVYSKLRRNFDTGECQLFLTIIVTFKS